MKVYKVKEVFYTLQGEGTHAGRVSIFCRFSGCNLWSGKEEDREKALCKFCDTDFVGVDGQNGGIFERPQDLVDHLLSFWRDKDIAPFVVFTGGEPLLQLDDSLIACLKANGVIISVETNGTILPPEGIDHLCVSPKGVSKFKVVKGDEIKVVYPQRDLDPADFVGLDFKKFYIQPMDHNPNPTWSKETQSDNTRAAVQYCLDNPKWSLSLQGHKILGID
jgi:7-carboxy-7-deazaguanine synthase (Cx14CxxC type)